MSKEQFPFLLCIHYRKEYRDGESLSSDTIPSDPGGSTPNAMKVAHWNRVDRKLAFPRPQKNEVYSHIQSLCTQTVGFVVVLREEAIG